MHDLDDLIHQWENLTLSKPEMERMIKLLIIERKRLEAENQELNDACNSIEWP